MSPPPWFIYAHLEAHLVRQALADAERPWYDFIWPKAKTKRKHVKEKERRMAESEEKKRFRSFAERYVVARAHLFPVENELDAAWQCMLNAKTAYKMINSAGSEFDPLPDAAEQAPVTQGGGQIGGNHTHRLPNLTASQIAARMAAMQQAQSQPAIAAKVAAIKAATPHDSDPPWYKVMQQFNRKGKSWMK